MIINLLETGSFQKGVDAIKNNFTKAIITNWQIWPAA
jgi:protein Mpv17